MSLDSMIRLVIRTGAAGAGSGAGGFGGAGGGVGGGVGGATRGPSILKSTPPGTPVPIPGPDVGRQPTQPPARSSTTLTIFVGTAIGAVNGPDGTTGAELPLDGAPPLGVGTSSTARGPTGGANGAKAATWGSSGIWNNGISTNAAI